MPRKARRRESRLKDRFIATRPWTGRADGADDTDDPKEALVGTRALCELPDQRDSLVLDGRPRTMGQQGGRSEEVVAKATLTLIDGTWESQIPSLL